MRLSSETDVPRGNLRLVGVGILLGICALAIAAPLYPRDPLEIDKLQQLASPSGDHLLGTDEFGRDILSRTLFGARLSIAAAAVGVLTAVSLGIPIGLLAGYLGGGVDAILMRLIDALLAFPAVLLALAILAILGPSSVTAMIAAGLVGTPLFSRITRASVLTERAKEYVEAAHAIGAGSRHIMFRTILPNCQTPIVVQITVTASQSVLLEAALSFLGLGTQPPQPSWGGMLFSARAFLDRAPWYAIAPGVAISLLVLGLNLLADAIQGRGHQGA